MKIYKENSPIELALQQVEALLQTLGLSITAGGNIHVELRLDGKIREGVIKDTENGECTSSIPRCLEHERIVLNE